MAFICGFQCKRISFSDEFKNNFENWFSYYKIKM